MELLLDFGAIHAVLKAERIAERLAKRPGSPIEGTETVPMPSGVRSDCGFALALSVTDYSAAKDALIGSGVAPFVAYEKTSPTDKERAYERID
jgi:hypothetical protein